MSEPQNSPSSYEEVCTFDEDGVSAKLTRRLRPGGHTQYSFSLYREYQTSDEQRQTRWLDARHIDAISVLGERVRERIALEKDRERSQSRATTAR
jgi:hypothetical protein